MSWNSTIPATRPTLPRGAAGRARTTGERFTATSAEAEAPSAFAGLAPVASAALLLLQSEGPSRPRDTQAEAAAAIDDLAQLQMALLRGTDLARTDLEGLANRAETLARSGDADASPAGAIALRLRVEIARRELVPDAKTRAQPRPAT